MFLGVSFAGTDTAVSNTAAKEASVSSFVISHSVLGELYATKDILVKFDWKIPETWTFNTYLHVVFQGNTLAGNVSYSESVVDKVKIKKRYQGDFAWKTIYEKEIRDNEDFSIEFYDYYAPSNRDIEYAYVAVISNADVDPISAFVHSEFDHYFICDKKASYPMMLDVENTVTFNRESKTVVSPGRKYPYVIHNGIANYYSGTMTATFIESKNCELDIENGWKYRNQIDTFLANGEAKILKSMEGDMWMIHVVGNLPRTNRGHYQYVSHQIEWVECGDPNKVGDLYDHGFIDTDVDRE